MWNFRLENQEINSFQKYKQEHLKNVSKLNNQISAFDWGKKLKKLGKNVVLPPFFKNNRKNKKFSTDMVSISTIVKTAWLC